MLIYRRDQTPVFHRSAVDVLMDNSLQLFVSSKIISEYFFVYTKSGISEDDIWHFYEKFKRITSVLNPGAESNIHLVRISKKIPICWKQFSDMETVSITMANGIPSLAIPIPWDFQEVTEIEFIQLLKNE